MEIRHTERSYDAESAFEATFQNAFVGIAHVDLSGRWLRVNDTLCRVLGYSEEELRRRTFQELTHPDDLDADLALLRQVLRGETDRYRLTKRYLRKDGATIWADLQVCLQVDADGKPAYFISSVLDISESKNLEERLRQRTLELENFVDVIVHELRNPLNSIGITTQLLQLLSERDHASEEIRNKLASVQQIVANTSEFVSYLQSMASAKSGATVLSVVDLRELIDQAVAVADLAGAGAEVRSDSPRQLALAHPAALLHVLHNLLDNSIKYRRSDAPCVVTIAIRRGKKRVRVTIQDNGRGIPADQLNAVFLPLRRATNVGDVPGFGLGLALCRRLLESMNATIKVASVESEGTTVTLSLPVPGG